MRLKRERTNRQLQTGLRGVSDGPDARNAINRDGGALSVVGRIGLVRDEN